MLQALAGCPVETEAAPETGPALEPPAPRTSWGPDAEEQARGPESAEALETEEDWAPAKEWAPAGTGWWDRAIPDGGQVPAGKDQVRG